MLRRFIVLHATGSHQLPEITSTTPWRHWSTCVRSLAIGFEDFLRPPLSEKFQIFRGLEAYQFLLEIACGLHSPILGETEVFGQFKDLIKTEAPLGTDWCKLIQKILEAINVDVKGIRHRHLVGVGRDSYGSFVRRQLKNQSEVHLLGAGNLAQEIAPWLTKQNKLIFVHARNQELAKMKWQEFGHGDRISFSGMNDTLGGAVVVCAPLSAVELARLLRSHDIQLVIDLRGQSGSDPLELSLPVVRLNDVFEAMQFKRLEAEARVERAKQEILLHAREKLDGSKRIFRVI